MTDPLLALPTSNEVLFDYRSHTRIAHIVLNRPNVLNAINLPLLTALVESLRKVEVLEAKVCIISGNGSSFCSGEDLKETLAPNSGGVSSDELRFAFHGLQEITRLMAGTGTVFIASVQGWAVGGGAEIALAADFVVAGPEAEFMFPEIIHGHAPTGGITSRLPQIVGLNHAKKILLLGESISAPTAASLNIVTNIVDEPLAYSKELAERLANMPARSLASIKRSLEMATFPHTEDVLRAEVEAASWCFADPIAAETFEKFKQRKIQSSTTEDPEATKPSNCNETMVMLLSRAAKSHNTRPFLRFGKVDVSYQQFLVDVKRLAGGLVQVGVKKGDIVAAMMLNSEEMACAWFATMWIGAVWGPLNTDFRGTVLERSLSLLSPKLLIVDSHLLPYIPNQEFAHIVVHDASHMTSEYPSLLSLKSSSPVEPVFTHPTSTACFLFTSGTTGASKACELSHEYFLSAANALISSLRLTSTDILYCPFPLYHADATAFTMIPALVLGATAAISTRFSASRWWDEIRVTRASVADFMGATMSILFKSPASPCDRDHCLRLMWGVPVPLWAEQFEERFGVKVVEVYGQTETGLPVVQLLEKPRVPSSCGVALPDIKLRVVDDTGSDVSPGKLGEILVHQRPSTRFKGYYRNLDATSQAIRNGWFYTGDLGRLDAEGNLFFAGRKKQVIRRRGENISAFEVIEGFLIHPDIVECAAYGVPSELTEEDLALAVVKRTGSQLSAKDVHSFAVQTMTRFHVPRYIHFVDGLPKTATGKLQGFMLQDEWKKIDRTEVWDFSPSR